MATTPQGRFLCLVSLLPHKHDSSRNPLASCATGQRTCLDLEVAKTGA